MKKLTTHFACAMAILLFLPLVTASARTRAQTLTGVTTRPATNTFVLGETVGLTFTIGGLAIPPPAGLTLMVTFTTEEQSRGPLGQNRLWNAPTLTLAPGETQNVTLPTAAHVV